ncbi:similar to follicular lymphoma variant translocation 1 [Ectocarpus siliculosus]|uniref:Similar to follicular lymphoma variant translocation 1 n=1 Tax=Ectocarpus siliculosus TaxID=2880 RepID=D7FNF9_ECTSI|nr:similar to follicular lymphoma variant translocation 1 [Ectocarpus siliculosus]|eukprot:CBJ25970.1 similar to follicular lymphoma variant translocation 1 [Ectocarpus siliculosus]
MEVKAYGIGVAVAYPPDTDTPGFERENVGKPEVTRLIGEDAGGLFSPTQVAATMVKGLKAGDFCITLGGEGYLVGLATAGFAPCFSVSRALCQVLSAGVLRAASFYYNWRFYAMAAAEKRRKDVSSAAASVTD